MDSVAARITYYRAGRAKCGHCKTARVGPHRTISGYSIETCPGCSNDSLLFGAHGYCGVIALSVESAERYEPASMTVTEVLDDLGLLAS